MGTSLGSSITEILKQDHPHAYGDKAVKVGALYAV